MFQMDPIEEQRLRTIQREYLDFLDDGVSEELILFDKQNFVLVKQEDEGVYQDKLKMLIANDESRLIVNINDLRRKNPRRTKM